MFQRFVRRPASTASTCSLLFRDCPVICSGKTIQWHSWTGLSRGQHSMSTVHNFLRHLAHFHCPLCCCARGVKSWGTDGRRGNSRRNGGGFGICEKETPPLASHRREEEEEECKEEVDRFHHLSVALTTWCSLICLTAASKCCTCANMRGKEAVRAKARIQPLTTYEELLALVTPAGCRRNPGDPAGQKRLEKTASSLPSSFPLRYDLPFPGSLFLLPRFQLPDISSLHTPTLLFPCVIIDSPSSGRGTLQHSWLDFLSCFLSDKKIRVFVNKASVLLPLSCISSCFCVCSFDLTCSLQIMTHQYSRNVSEHVGSVTQESDPMQK